MKKIFLLFLPLLLLGCGGKEIAKELPLPGKDTVAVACDSCQPRKFEGRIEYSVKVKSDNPNIPESMLAAMYGKHMTFIYKDGNSKWESSSSVSLYLVKENKSYYQFRPDSVYFVDGRTIVEAVMDYGFLEEKENVLGRDCRAFFIQTKVDQAKTTFYKQRKRTYYFNPELYADSDLFRNCHTNNTNLVSAQTKALPLKLIDSFDGAEVTMQATKVEHMTLSEDLFRIKKLPMRELK